ncbi:unnamed protein product [Adineta steineri]|uniref:cysteine dioxygenase n=1 Tax=Adineta steineri TaxID=433720 RepID=A0A814F5A4_9BILA|nr:unnamed protein product [Adineta steineri]CAF0980113.1 unnamed protein product [Adineta steineri]CAF1123649.1 unnamed protein product [Adineta steineri]
MVKVTKEVETIKQQMMLVNGFQLTIEKLVTTLQQQLEKTNDHISQPNDNDFSPPTNVWCPWRSDSCTEKIIRPGQMTIVMEQEVSLPFALYLSASNDPNDSRYVIHFSIDKYRVKIGKTVNGITTIINETIHHEYILQEGKNIYWLSIDHVNLFIKYGHGEVRDRSTLLKSGVSLEEKNSVGQIQYVHVSFNGSRILSELTRYEDKVKFKIGQYPVVLDPPLLVANTTNLDHYLHNSFILLSRLKEPCQSLYLDIIGWKFQDDAFPHLYEAIEYSIRNESGWCYKTLRKKASTFGVSDIHATYLRITIGSNMGTSPGVPYVLEIWPPGHFSPIHSHASTYGIIRVLHGEINVKIYRTLSLKKMKHIHEATFYENQVTWLSPGLNQVHKLENKSPNKSCITIQAYEYISDEVNHYEFFDYIDNNGSSIKNFKPVPDLDYTEFKNIMITEWNNRN